jgi:hypothetical protein
VCSSAYYYLHTRSLFISKFNYFRRFEIVRLSQLKVILSGSGAGFILMCLFFFLCFGVLPEVRYLSLRTYAGAEEKSLVFCSYKFFSSGLIFKRLLALSFFYFGLLENSERLHKLFVFTVSSSFTSIRVNSIFYIFLELEYLVNYAYTFLKLVTSSWVLIIKLSNLGATHLERTTLLRTLLFPFSSN